MRSMINLFNINVLKFTKAPKLPISSLRLATLPTRLYSAKAQTSKKNDETPGFKKIFLVGIIGTIIFVKTVQSLDKNKPKTTFSEEEFDDVMAGLRRRVAIFSPGQLDVKFVLSDNKTDIQKLVGTYDLLVDPATVVEHYRNTENDPYEALLNEFYCKYGEENYVQNLPAGMLVMLIGRYMKEKCHPSDSVVIQKFPSSIQDSIKFENEVSVISKVLVPKKCIDSDVSKYYQTVNKVQEY